MTTLPKTSNLGDTYAAKYDAWNRLVSLDTTAAVYTYDGLHRRIVRTEGSDTTHFYYNENWQVVTETNGSGTATAAYLWNPEYIDSLAVRMTSSSHPGGEGDYFFTHDANYNVSAAVKKNNSGSDPLVERYHYSPYGEVTVLDADFTLDSATDDGKSDIGNEFLFTGRRLDPETGLQQSRYRYYHAQLGRFVNRDPIGYWGGMNLYQYVGGMPTIDLDPLGLCTHLGNGLFKDCDGTGRCFVRGPGGTKIYVPCPGPPAQNPINVPWYEYEPNERNRRNPTNWQYRASIDVTIRADTSGCKEVDGCCEGNVDLYLKIRAIRAKTADQDDWGRGNGLPISGPHDPGTIQFPEDSGPNPASMSGEVMLGSLPCKGGDPISGTTRISTLRIEWRVRVDECGAVTVEKLEASTIASRFFCKSA